MVSVDNRGKVDVVFSRGRGCGLRLVIAVVLVVVVLVGGVWWGVARHRRQQEERECAFSSEMNDDYWELIIGFREKGLRRPLVEDGRCFDPGEWFDDAVVPSARRNMAMAIAVYNRSHPSDRVTVEGVGAFFGREWAGHVARGDQRRGPEVRFLDWCNEKADLVYLNDEEYEIDGRKIVHKRGENSGFSFSRYDYLVNKDDAFKNLRKKE